MNQARQKTQEYVISRISEIIPGSKNKAIYEDFFSRLSDDQFDKLMARMEEDGECFPFYNPNFAKTRIDLEHVFKLLEKEGGKATEKVWVTSPSTGVRHLTPLAYPILYTSIRIQQQKLPKKMSVPKDNNHVDDLTNQPTTESKGSSLSYPEIQILYAMGLDVSMEELIKARGGDEVTFRNYNNEIINTGSVMMSAISSGQTKVKSTKTVSTILKAMHLDNNL